MSIDYFISEPYALKTNSLFGRLVEPIHDLLEPLANGSLVIKPFPPSAYRQDVHSITTYCLATDSIGTMISTPQRVRAGMCFSLLITTQKIRFIKAKAVLMI